MRFLYLKSVSSTYCAYYILIVMHFVLIIKHFVLMSKHIILPDMLFILLLCSRMEDFDKDENTHLNRNIFIL